MHLQRFRYVTLACLRRRNAPLRRLHIHDSEMRDMSGRRSEETLELAGSTHSEQPCALL